MNVTEKTAELRKSLAAACIDAFLVTGADPHLGEYQPLRWRTREFISGFTGSAGTVIITQDEALLWVDSRYFIQAAKEIQGTCFSMMKDEMEGVPSPDEWLLAKAAKGFKVGVDGSSISIAAYHDLKKKLARKGAELVITGDLLDQFWEDRPAVPCSGIIKLPEELAGETSGHKLGRIRAELRRMNVGWTFISSLDDIAWLTNLRADDIRFVPVFVAWCYVSLDEAILFVEKDRLAPDALEAVSKDFTLCSYYDVHDKLRVSGPGYLDTRKVNASFEEALKNDDNVTGLDLTTLMKTCKNEAELEGMRKAHILDAAAYAEFLSKLDRNGSYHESEISALLAAEREKQPGYLGPSFSPISGWGPNGAMCHYSATDEGALISGPGLLVLDTGSHFEFGTTDITRTLLFGGEATEDQKRDYTIVLKGHLALMHQKFFKGTRGLQLDVLAKQYLWNYGETFYHGTGHGVGHRLSVHEGPLRINTAMIDVPLQPGMIVSDEPGVYKEGRYGIRIENLVAVREKEVTEFGTFYEFENLTFVPYEISLLDFSILTDTEKGWINAYHQEIRKLLAPYISEEAAAWLEKAAADI